MNRNHRIVRIAQHSVSRPGLGLCGLFIIGLLQAAFAADDASIYTTIDQTEVTNTVSNSGNTTTTTTTQTTREVNRPGSAENRLDAWQNDPNAANFPYDSTGGAHRSDIDTARKGFDDPRNPWDGRYTNDNPANHPVGSSYDRGEPVTNYTPDKYRPGAFGTSKGN